MNGVITKKELLASRYISEEYGMDSMAHATKGNIGFFISGGKNIICKQINVTNIENLGTFERPPKMNDVTPQGEKVFTQALVACESVELDGTDINGDFFKTN